MHWMLATQVYPNAPTISIQSYNKIFKKKWWLSRGKTNYNMSFVSLPCMLRNQRRTNSRYGTSWTNKHLFAYRKLSFNNIHRMLATQVFFKVALLLTNIKSYKTKSNSKGFPFMTIIRWPLVGFLPVCCERTGPATISKRNPHFMIRKPTRLCHRKPARCESDSGYISSFPHLIVK